MALGPRRRLSRQTAWGCLTANLALPGAGSLAAGRVSGYAQLALAAVGMVITVVFGGRFIIWYLANWGRFNGPQADPLETLIEVWRAVRWALAGLGIFAIGWLWALGTGMGIVKEAKTEEAPPITQ